MITAKIEELNYNLKEIIEKQGTSPTTVLLPEQLLNKIDTMLQSQNKPVFFRTYIREDKNRG